MSSLAYKYACLQVTEPQVNEFVKLYYELEEPNYEKFESSVESTSEICRTFMVEAREKLYKQTLRHIYWTICVLADPGKVGKEVSDYIQMFNPFFEAYNHQTKDLFKAAVDECKWKLFSKESEYDDEFTAAERQMAKQLEMLERDKDFMASLNLAKELARFERDRDFTK